MKTFPCANCGTDLPDERGRTFVACPTCNQRVVNLGEEYRSYLWDRTWAGLDKGFRYGAYTYVFLALYTGFVDGGPVYNQHLVILGALAAGSLIGAIMGWQAGIDDYWREGRDALVIWYHWKHHQEWGDNCRDYKFRHSEELRERLHS